MCRVEHNQVFRNCLNALDIDTKFQAKLREENLDPFDQAWLDACYQKCKHHIPVQERQSFIQFNVQESQSEDGGVSVKVGLNLDEFSGKFTKMPQYKNYIHRLVERVELDYEIKD